MYTSENNWYSWSYDDRLFGRQTSNDKFNTNYGQYNGRVSNFKDELLNAARSTIDHCDSTPVILFSGGIDSEIMLRAFLEIGANPEILIARYENDYNIYEGRDVFKLFRKIASTSITLQEKHQKHFFTTS